MASRPVIGNVLTSNNSTAQRGEKRDRINSSSTEADKSTIRDGVNSTTGVKSCFHCQSLDHLVAQCPARAAARKSCGLEGNGGVRGVQATPRGPTHQRARVAHVTTDRQVDDGSAPSEPQQTAASDLAA